MQQVIEKALTKASKKGMSISDTAELVTEYLEIAGVLSEDSDFGPHGNEQAKSNPVNTSGGIIVIDSRGSGSFIEPPPFPVESVIGSSAWNVDDLFNAISGESWEFTCRPEGREKDLKFVGRPSLRGNIGVAIEFKSDDLEFADRHLNLFQVFVDTGSSSIDKEQLINEAKTQAMQMLRLRKSPIVSTVQVLTQLPPMGGVNSSHGFGADIV